MSGNGGSAQESSVKVPRIYIRGGCETVAISHYFEVLTDRLVSEFSFARDGIAVRLDHSQMLKLALEKPGAERMAPLLALGYQRSDFDTAFLDSIDEGRCVYVLGVWAEENNTVFRHTRHGFLTLVYLNNKIGGVPSDLLSLDLESLPETVKNSGLSDALLELQNNYDSNAIKMLPRNSLVFLIWAPEKTMDSKGRLRNLEPHIDLNRVLKACAQESERVIFLNMDEYID